VVDGIQQNVMAIVKHYIGNTQETARNSVNELVSEKLLMELYGPPFEAAVQKAAGVMCAYNRVNGVYACENPFTLKTMLKGRYNFSGFVVSDWVSPDGTTAVAC
jgi:beta-glucosidase